MSASGRVRRRRMPCQAPCEAASGVRLRAGTLSTPSTDISTSRIQTGAPGAMRMARASSCGAPSAYSASTRSRTWPTWRSPAVRAPGRNSQWRWAGVRAGGALASQPAAREGGMLREGSWLRIMPRAAPGPLRRDAAGRAAAGLGIQWRPWKSTHLQAHVRAWALFAPRGRWLYRARLGPRRRRGGVRTGRPRVSRPGHHAGTRRAGARPRASRY